MKRRFRPGSLLFGLFALGCGTEGVPAHPTPQAAWSAGELDAGSEITGDDASTGSSPGSTALTGLPCDVANLLSSHCTACHGATLAGGATVHLTSWEELTAPSPTNASQSVGEQCAARMRDVALPMPPVGSRVADADITVFENWVKAGMPEGSCATAAVDDIFSKPATCTSAKMWTGGDRESPDMHPGRACIDCHKRGVRGETGPTFSLAGTLYASGHDPDDCNGVSAQAAQATIEITDANGKVTKVTPRASGNFYVEGRALATPYTARVLYDGRVRAMATPQTSGDCNSCHTASGANGAPGRIALP